MCQNGLAVVGDPPLAKRNMIIALLFLNRIFSTVVFKCTASLLILNLTKLFVSMNALVASVGQV